MAQQEAQEIELSGEELLDQDMAAFESEIEEAEYIEEPEDNEEEIEEEEEEISEIAKKDGYMTKEQWVASGKDEDDYLSEEDFAKVGELRDDKGISRQKMAKDFVKMQATMTDFMKSQKAQLEAAERRGREEEIAKLKAKQQEAVDYGNTEDALEIEREINKVTAPVSEPKPPQLDPDVQSWYDNNQYWYDNDPQAASLIRTELAKTAKQGLDFSEGIKIAESKCKKYFPQHFDDEDVTEKPKSKKPLVRPRAVTESGSKVKKPKKLTFNDLPEEMRSIARRMQKDSGLTEHEYVEQMQ